MLIATLVAGAAEAGSLRDWFAQRRAQAEHGEPSGADASELLFDEPQSPRATIHALPAGVRRLADLPYGPDAKQRMDIYLPATGSKDRLSPIVMMVHGGGWRLGDKAMSGVVTNKVARWVPNGTILVSINYRLLPQANPSEQADDVARALAVVQTRAPEWGGDPARVILMGHSAGAHLVALLGADPTRAYALGAKPWQAVVSLDSGAVDVVEIMTRRHLPLYDQAFGSDAGFWRQVSPYHRLTHGAVPFLLVCSSRRVDQPCTQAERLARKADEFGVRAEVVAQALTHGEINDRLGLPGAYTDAVEHFMQTLAR